MNRLGMGTLFFSFVFLFSSFYSARAGETEPPLSQSWTREHGSVHNAGNSTVMVIAEKADGSIHAHDVPAGSELVLPQGTVNVHMWPGTIFPEGEEASIDLTVSIHNFHEETGGHRGHVVGRVTSPGGGNASFSDPTGYFVSGLRLMHEFNPPHIIAPGAKAPGRRLEGAPEEEALSDEDFLRNLNDNYMRYSGRLREIDPDSEEARAIRDALPHLEEIITDRMRRMEETYGENWLDRFVDPLTGMFPGGFLSHDRILDEPIPKREEGEIKGYVAKRNIYDNELTFQTVYPYGRAMLLSNIMELPPEPERVSDFNIVWYVTYAEVPDNKLFEEFKRALEVRVKVDKRIKAGNRRITEAEFKSCLRLMELKEDVLKKVQWKAGSLPEWRGTTDAEGTFSFIADKFPGKDNVIYLIVHVASFPPEGMPSPCYISGQTPGIGTAEFSIGWQSPRFINGNEIPPDLAAAYPFKGDLEIRRTREEKALEEARGNMEDVSGRWPVNPPALEERWQDRALTGQRALEESYNSRYGPGRNWPGNIRERFEAELAAVPDDAKRTWERDKAAYDRDRRRAIDAAGQRLAIAERALERTDAAITKVNERRDKWYERVISTIGDIAVIVPEDPQLPPHVFTQGGDISGGSFVPQTETGKITRAFLVKQVIDENIRKAPVVGKYIETGESAVFYDPEKEGSPGPPFEFKLDPAIKEHRIIYDRQRLAGGGTAASEIYTLFEGLVTPDMLPSRLEMIFVPIPPMVEVEGFPIADSDEFHERVDAFLKEYDNVTDEASKELDAVMEGRQAGTVSREAAAVKQMEITRRWQEKTADVMRRMNDYTKDNPAFRR